MFLKDVEYLGFIFKTPITSSPTCCDSKCFLVAGTDVEFRKPLISITPKKGQKNLAQKEKTLHRSNIVVPIKKSWCILYILKWILVFMLLSRRHFENNVF